MIHPRSLLWFALLVAPACDKPNDQPVLQDEVVATAGSYDSRLDELKHRADDVDRRRAALPRDTPSSAAAEHSLGQARTVIGDQRSYLQTVRTRLKAIPSGAPGQVQALLDEMRQRVDDGLTEATADLEAVESWVAIAQQQQRPGAQPPPPPAPEAVPEDRAPDTDASGAPIR